MCWECELAEETDELLPALAPVVLPTAAELVEAANRSVALEELRQYVSTLDGASARGTGLLPRWAEACGLVRVHKGTHVPMKKNAKLLKQPLELWEQAHAAMDEAGYGIATEDETVPFSFGILFPQLLGMLRMTLYSAGSVPLPLELLYQLADSVPGLLLGFDTDEPDPSWRRGLLVTLDLLERLGAVERSTTTDPAELAEIAELTGVTAPDPTLFRLTPIALWATNRMLRAEGTDAPVVGELARETLDKVCAHLGVSPPEIAEAEMTAWVAHREPSAAADEAADFLRRTDAPANRLFALLALGRTGEPGVTAAARVRSDGGIPGAVTAVWLVERDKVAPETITPEEMALGFTDHFAALHDQGMLLTELCAMPDQDKVVDIIVMAEHPARLELLDVIAQEHPDRKVAKRARKARLRLRLS